MTARSGTVRLAVLTATAAIVVAACGGGSDERVEPSGSAGGVDVVLDTAPDVESAIVDSTTTTTTGPPETTTTSTSAPQPDTTTPPPATPAPTAPPETESTGVPVGYRPIIDETGELRANVPAAWFDTNGAPDGAFRQLAAAPDLDGFLDGYTLPGMLLITGAAATPDVWMEGLSTTLDVAESDGCTISDTSDYSDGVYTGTEYVLSCGSTTSVAHLIGGRNSEGDLFFLLALVRPTDDLGVRDQIVQSFYID